MHSDRHHIRAYVLFLFISLCFVGILFYLYTPNSFSGSQSNALIISPEVSLINTEIKLWNPLPTLSQEIGIIVNPVTSNDTIAQRRIRLTRLLLHYQQELLQMKTLYDLDAIDIKDQEKLTELRAKISNIQKKIELLSQ
jgi:hypothetical protein